MTWYKFHKMTKYLGKRRFDDNFVPFSVSISFGFDRTHFPSINYTHFMSLSRSISINLNISFKPCRLTSPLVQSHSICPLIFVCCVQCTFYFIRLLSFTTHSCTHFYCWNIKKKFSNLLHTFSMAFSRDRNI